MRTTCNCTGRQIINKSEIDKFGNITVYIQLQSESRIEDKKLKLCY